MNGIRTVQLRHGKYIRTGRYGCVKTAIVVISMVPMGFGGNSWLSCFISSWKGNWARVVAHPSSPPHHLVRHRSCLPSSGALRDPDCGWKFARGWGGEGRAWACRLQSFSRKDFLWFCFLVFLVGGVSPSHLVVQSSWNCVCSSYWILDPPIHSFFFYPPSYLLSGEAK